MKYKIIELGREKIDDPQRPGKQLWSTTRTLVKDNLSWKEARELARTNKQYEVVIDRS